MIVEHEYDLLVLGCGEAGKYIAWTLAKKGLKAAVIERKYVGGSCPNIACLPSKNIIHDAKVVSYFSRSEEFGITKDHTAIDMKKVRDRKRNMVDGLIQVHLDNFKKSGANLVLGTGRFIAPKTIEVTTSEGKTEIFRGKKIIINTGTRATVPTIPGLAEAHPMTHIEALELDEIPKHLIVIGGGYISLELAQAMRRFGSQVTIIDRNERLAHREDPDVSEALLKLCQDEGINVVLKATVNSIEGVSGRAVKVTIAQEGSEKTLEGSHLLVAVGRTPNTQNIGLESAGIALTDRGYIKVNEHLETTGADTWAVGDCAGSPHFTHVAFDDFRIVIDNIGGGLRVTTNRLIPFCLFTDPELARVGLNESEAKAKGIAYRLGKIPMAAVLRSRTLSETRGFLKVLVDKNSDKILGFTAFGVGAGEIMSVVQVAMLGNQPYTVLSQAIFAHPTLPEGLIPLFSNLQ